MELIMNKLCSIISGGNFSPLDDIKKSNFIIACDKGYEYALKSKITPDLIVGDFDSCNILPKIDLNHNNILNNSKIVKLNKEKDETDTMFAVRYAIEHDFNEIFFYCFLGGRFDHTIANIQAASYAMKKINYCKVFDEENEIHFIRDRKIIIPKRKNCSLSLFSLSDCCRGVSINNVKYPLYDATLNNCFPIGVSNEWINDAEIIVSSGILMIVISKLN